MKTITMSTAIVVTLLLPIVALSYSIDLEYGWRAEDVQLGTTGGYDQLGVEGGVFIENTLSRIYDVRLLPEGYRVSDYHITSEEWEELSGTYRVGIRGEGVVEVMLGDDLGGFENVTSGDVLGYSVLISSIKPLRVVEGKVSVLRHLEVEIECSPQVDGLKVGRRSQVADRHLRTLIGRILGVDAEIYGSWGVEGYKDWVSDGPSLDGGVVDCVIVTDESMVSEFERLAAWHDGLGVRTVVRTVSWIDSHYPGSDGPERIRNFLKDAYENWGTLYALMGGVPPLVPIRYGWTNHYGGALIPTDAYYANLEGNWNADGDDIFGEWGTSPDIGDVVTFYAQLILGRAPVKTLEEAQIFIDKTINYVTDPDPGFPASALFLGEVIFPVDWKPGDAITLDGGTMCDTAAAYFPAYFDTCLLYQKVGTMTRTTCLDGFTRGYDYTIIAGHGDAFRTSAAEGDPPYINNADFDTLSNTNRYGFVYALNCNNSAVDVDCVFRHLLINPSGGGIATYATTRYDFPNVGQYFLNEFLSFLFQRDVTRLGDVCALHHLKFIPSGQLHDGAVRWSLLTYILLGDPVINLWVNEPVDLAITKPPQLALSDSTLTVEVADGGVGVEGAVVVLRGDRGEYGVGVSDGSGFATVNYRPLGLGWSDVVVWAEGYRLYEDSVEVVGSGGRLYVSSVSIDDGSGWVGNDDGEVGWGERVGLGVGLVNGGSGSVSGVSCTLRVVTGCSLYVRVRIDSMESDTLVYLGLEGAHPGSMPFGVVAGESVLGRGVGSVGEDLGCWLWLDGMGWHLRMIGDGDSHSYVCSVGVYGELLGGSGYGLGVGDSLREISGGYEFIGSLGSSDYEDGMDLLLGDSDGIVVHDGTEGYGTVGSSEVVGWYDVEFDGMRFGDQLGIWFEALLEDGVGGSWRDWFKVLVRDGAVLIELVDYAALGGDTLGVWYGLRNVGGGGLRGIEGRLRGLSGVEVYDSVSVYGEISSGGYSEGDGYKVRELGGPVSYEVYVVDTNGRSWTDTVDVRGVLGVSGLNYEAGSAEVSLRWVLSGDSLLYGYDIYRSDESGGVYSRVGYVDGYSWYVDEGLQSEEDYYYYICARDGMGNVSAPSETLEAWTGPPYLTGWPTGPDNVMPSSPVAADLDRDGDLELIIGSKDEFVHVWHHDGTVAPGWPCFVGDEVWSSAAVGNLDGDPDFEFIIGTNGGNLYAWNLDGTGVRMPDGLFRLIGGSVKGAPALDDLDDDNDVEVVAANTYGQVYVFHHDGTGFLQSNGFFAQADGQIIGSPSLADIDDDGDVDIIVGTADGTIYVWNPDGTGYLNPDGTFAAPGGMYGSIAVGDVDGNGDMELVMAGLYWHGVGVFDHDGSYRWGWPKNVDAGTYVSPALAELDGDGKLDIIMATFRGTYDESASVYVFANNGDLRPGWPKTMEADFFSSPVVGDIDGDGEVDIVVPSVDGRIYAWHKDGSIVRGWPRNLLYPFYATPVLEDLDDDGDLDLVAAGYDGLVHVFDISAAYDKDTMEWPKLCHDLFNSGLYNGPSRAGVPRSGDDRVPATLMLSGYPNPASIAVSVRLGIPSTASQKVRVDVYDVLGRHVANIHSDDLEPGFHELIWNAHDKHSRRVASGIYFIKVAQGKESLSRKIVLVR
jgi:hypothetical protein